jgi:hypothetical protein
LEDETMFYIRGFAGRTMRLVAASTTLFAAMWLCLGPYPAEAAEKYDGSTPFVCVPTAVAECSADGDCRPDTAESVNLPDFFKVDLKTKSIRADDQGRQSAIKLIQRVGGELSLYGSEAERSWILIIREKTGKMSASITGDGESFVIFGVCPVP